MERASEAPIRGGSDAPFTDGDGIVTRVERSASAGVFVECRPLPTKLRNAVLPAHRAPRPIGRDGECCGRMANPVLPTASASTI